MNKPTIREVIVVEGRYDKNAVLQAVDATVVETGGFGIFSQPEKRALLRRLQQERGLIVLTDGDGAGFLIRGHLKSILPPGVKHAYIPDTQGKERRKRSPSKEGKLGVEGMKPAVIVEALLRAGATVVGATRTTVGGRPYDAGITKADLYADGLSGRPDSAGRRATLLRALDLPERMTAGAMLEAINLLLTREEYHETVAKM